MQTNRAPAKESTVMGIVWSMLVEGSFLDVPFNLPDVEVDHYIGREEEPGDTCLYMRLLPFKANNGKV